MKDFLKATIVGGVLFLLPVSLVLVVLGYPLGLTTSSESAHMLKVLRLDLTV